MNIIIPMAGMGKRLRPHTLTIPKPLVPVAGKPIVQHLVEDIAKLLDEPLRKVVFVTGNLDKKTEQSLLKLAEGLGAQGEIAYQKEALGTAHAVWCAKSALEGKTIVAFADTLFDADFKIDPDADGVIWVKQIDDPSSFGVVQLDEDGVIKDYVEKPETFVSDLAMIGIYYFKHGEDLAREIQYLIDNEIIKGGEYQLPDAFRRMTERGAKFVPGEVNKWMDCGNPKVTIETNSEVLKLKFPESKVSENAKVENSIIIDPCYIGEGATIKNSVVGPNVTIGPKSAVENCRLENLILQNESSLQNASIKDSMIGNKVSVKLKPQKLNLGDYNTIE
jgi:glucose-1-phosphate thymidylyltransferase